MTKSLHRAETRNTSTSSMVARQRRFGLVNQCMNSTSGNHSSSEQTYHICQRSKKSHLRSIGQPPINRFTAFRLVVRTTGPNSHENREAGCGGSLTDMWRKIIFGINCSEISVPTSQKPLASNLLIASNLQTNHRMSREMATLEGSRTLAWREQRICSLRTDIQGGARVIW